MSSSVLIIVNAWSSSPVSGFSNAGISILQYTHFFIVLWIITNTLDSGGLFLSSLIRSFTIIVYLTKDKNYFFLGLILPINAFLKSLANAICSGLSNTSFGSERSSMYFVGSFFSTFVISRTSFREMTLFCLGFSFGLFVAGSMIAISFKARAATCMIFWCMFESSFKLGAYTFSAVSFSSLAIAISIAFFLNSSFLFDRPAVALAFAQSTAFFAPLIIPFLLQKPYTLSSSEVKYSKNRAFRSCFLLCTIFIAYYLVKQQTSQYLYWYILYLWLILYNYGTFSI